jgi:hypothetical protein
MGIDQVVMCSWNRRITGSPATVDTVVPLDWGNGLTTYCSNLHHAVPGTARVGARGMRTRDMSSHSMVHTWNLLCIKVTIPPSVPRLFQLSLARVTILFLQQVSQKLGGQMNWGSEAYYVYGKDVVPPREHLRNFRVARQHYYESKLGLIRVSFWWSCFVRRRCIIYVYLLPLLSQNDRKTCCTFYC